MTAPARVEPRFLPSPSHDLTVLDLVAPAEPEDFEWALYANPIVDGRRLPSFAQRIVKAGWHLTKSQQQGLAIHIKKRAAAGVGTDEAKAELVGPAVRFAAARLHDLQAVRWGEHGPSEGGTNKPVHQPSRWLGVGRPSGRTEIAYSDSLTAASVDKATRRLEQLTFDGLQMLLDSFASLETDAERLDWLDDRGGFEKAKTKAWKEEQKKLDLDELMREQEALVVLVPDGEGHRRVRVHPEAENPTPPVEVLPNDIPSPLEAIEHREQILQLIAEIEAALPVERYGVLRPVLVNLLRNLPEQRLEKGSRKAALETWGPKEVPLYTLRRRFNEQLERAVEEAPEVLGLVRDAWVRGDLVA